MGRFPLFGNPNLCFLNQVRLSRQNGYVIISSGTGQRLFDWRGLFVNCCRINADLWSHEYHQLCSRIFTHVRDVYLLLVINDLRD